MTEYSLAALPFLAVVLASSVPAISVRFIAGRHLDAARDLWLLGLAWLAALASCIVISLPLGIMACAALLRWRSWQQFPAVATWAGILATWWLAQSLTPAARDWLQLGWRIITGALLVFAFAQRWHGYEVKATTGSRVLLAALLVLIWPFTSPWEWPAYALGIWLTSSWIALAALLVAIAVKYPTVAPWVAVFGACVVVAFLVRPLRLALIDHTPRGGSLDGLRMRWRTWSAMVRVTRHFPTWVIGWGPTPAGRVGPSLEHALALESVRLSALPGEDHAIATSPTHCEPLELACTYGLVAVIAMGIFAWQVGTHIVLGDAWSASAVAGIALSLATIPARSASVGVVWLIVLAVVIAR